MSRDLVAGATLGAAITAVLGLLWYRHWSGIPEVCAAIRSEPASSGAHPRCDWPQPHDAHLWRDVERDGYLEAKPRYCAGRS